MEWHGKTKLYLQTVVEKKECDMFSPIAGFVTQSDGLHPVNQTPVWRQQIGLQVHTNTYTKISFLLKHIYNLFSKLINYKWLVCRILFNQSERLMNMLHFLSLSLQAYILRFLWVLFLDQTQACPCCFSSHELQKPNWSRKSTPIWGQSLVWQSRL